MKKELHVHGHLLFIMRVSLIQIFLSLSVISLTLADDLGAQVLEQRISVRFEDQSVRSALTRIEELTGARFLYESQIMKGNARVSAAFFDESLANILSRILDPRKVHFEADGNQIVLTRAEAPAINVIDALVDITIIGRVVDDENQALPGVNVIVKGTTVGTTTDANGTYALKAADAGATLVFSFIGFQTQEVAVGNQSEINVTMVSDLKGLDEVVIVGYGEVKKSDLTGSVSSIKGSEINAYPATNVMQTLAGRATGVHIAQNNGSPGAPMSVRIRGTNSIQGGNEPLYVIDGFPYSGNPTLLNNADIESIEVLKDASATAIYGSRGANGVVLITTKRGKEGKTTVNYDGYYGVQTVRKKIDMMNSQEYAQFYNEQAANDGLAPHFTQAEIDAMGEGTDWQDVALQSAPVQNHSLSVMGGTASTKYSVSLGNFNQKGIIVGSDYVRNSIRANVSSDITEKLRFDVNMNLSRIDSDRKNSEKGNRGGSLISAMLSGYPTIGTHNPDGTYTNLATAYAWGSNAIFNPLNWIEQESDHITSNKVLSNASVSYEPIKGLVVKILGGIENTDDQTNYYQTKKFTNSTGSARVNSSRSTSLLNENTISYTKDFGRHHINAVGGFTYQDFVSTGLEASGTGFVSDSQESYDVGSAVTLGVPSTSYLKWTLLSYLGRVNYSFNEKYLATVSFRADGSSRYSDGQKWGSFPSASVAWRVSEEEFLKSVNFLSDLKVRAGYGETGSTAISPYQTLNQLVSTKVVFGDALYTAYAPGTRLAGPLKWETTAQFDVGIDVGILQNRFTLSADYYVKNTRDLLNSVTLPASLGYTSTIRNIGKMQNKGVELSLNSEILTGEFKWDLGANVSFNKNKIVKLYDGLDVLGPVINISVVGDNINILREGEAVGAFYGYVETGYDANGKITYADLNNSGGRDNGDKQIIGNPNPSMIFGLNSNMSYKNFQLNVFIQGTQGNDIFNLSAVNQTVDYGQALNMPRDVYNNHWTPENPDDKYPVISRSTQPQISTRFVEDGSYLRFKNIQLAYNLPVSTMNITWLANAQLYVSGQNLITFTKYSWYDPEINSYGSSNSIQLGIDHYGYPSAKTYTVGLKVGF